MNNKIIEKLVNRITKKIERQKMKQNYIKFLVNFDTVDVIQTIGLN